MVELVRAWLFDNFRVYLKPIDTYALFLNCFPWLKPHDFENISSGLTSDLRRQLKEIALIYRHQSDSKLANAAWSTSAYNVGKAILAATFWAENIIEEYDHQLATGNDLYDIEQLRGLLLDSRAAYEASHYDPDGYGYGTLNGIIDDIIELAGGRVPTRHIG